MPTRTKTATRRDSYHLTMNIPVEWWSGTDTMQTERLRANRRRWLRDAAKAEWKHLKKARQAWFVERFVALIAVAYPQQTDIFPARAAETVKPIIDAGSDVGLWPDDDSGHRCSTVYIESPFPAPVNHYQLIITIIPVPDRNPRYQIAGSLGQAITRQWADAPDRPSWDEGYMLRFTIPYQLWITSNYTDSDLIARQNGKKRAETWGRGNTLGVRERVTRRLQEHIVPQWVRQPFCRYDRYIIIACVAYPANVDRADPDNAAETVNAILKAGVQTGAWDSLSFSHCKGVAFIRMPNLPQHNTYGVNLIVLPAPERFILPATLSDSVAAAWAERDRRRA